MKNKIILFGIVGIIGITAISLSFTYIKKDMKDLPNRNTVIEIPANVQTVIDKSCVMCHHSDSKNSPAKINLSFDKFKTGDYSVAKIVGKLGNIINAIDDASMPPKKYLENNPQRVLTDNDKKIIKDWANKNISKFSE
jgi:hypothetical protein